MKNEAFVKRNGLGFWVGCVRFSNGVESEVSNACHKEYRALEIAERIAESAGRLDRERARFKKMYH